jgi:hypothetical protein
MYTKNPNIRRVLYGLATEESAGRLTREVLQRVSDALVPSE